MVSHIQSVGDEVVLQIGGPIGVAQVGEDEHVALEGVGCKVPGEGVGLVLPLLFLLLRDYSY